MHSNLGISLLLVLNIIVIILYVIYMGLGTELSSGILLKKRLFECQVKVTKFMNVCLHSTVASRTDAVVSQNSQKKDEKKRFSFAYRFPTHLLDQRKSGYLQSKGRRNVLMVLGIPTVRKAGSHLRATLYNLIENMNEQEQNETLVIIFIGETEWDHVEDITKQIESSFKTHLETGLIDIIAPASTYYPDYTEPTDTLGKQNLDLAYLMTYAHSKGSFYVQLEDDIMTRQNFITAMKKFTLIKSALANPFEPTWFVLDFCDIGFIGKLFKAADLPYLITYLQLFYNDMSAIELLLYLIKSKLCFREKNEINCNKLVDKLWKRSDEKLFQNVANISLKVKMRRLNTKGIN